MNLNFLIEVIFWFIILLFILLIVTYIFIKITEKKYFQETIPQKNYKKPIIKKLTIEQIENIHSRGNITPEEQLEEWLKFELCAPGDNIGKAKNRCKKFKNCKDCLIDYANQKDEYEKLDLKIVNKI